ncbi:GPW/gp25 family protein [Saccharopolyspora rosea]|uniref:GPW/gp25 family protein n=1 Tax=Saccharopolyspora rosea TaxID=524884 RepID=A0ABW3FTR2_9PSEU|nr:GPW/gp25 family protein [Saccharopolyspora rosea]
MDPELLGRGISFPVQLGVHGWGQSAGLRKVEESIRIILGTQIGERVMRPDFGSELRSLAFAPNDGSTADLARYHVEEALGRWEPRIDVLDVSVTNDGPQAALLIDITFRLRATQDVHHLVHEFPLERPP